MSTPAKRAAEKVEAEVIDNTPVTKKQCKDRARKLTAEEFCRLLQGPTVTVLVGPNKTEYVLPKRLAEHSSLVLERAFNGDFKEATEQTIHFEEESDQLMPMVLQWMYSDGTNVTLSEEAAGSLDTSISRWIEFARIADMLDLTGVGIFTADKIKKFVKDSHPAAFAVAKPPASHSSLFNTGSASPTDGMIPDASHLPFNSKHIHGVMKLPFQHAVRRIIAEAIAPSYMHRLKLGSAASKVPYRFQKEIRELEGFRSDLLLVIEEIHLRSFETSSFAKRRTTICNLTGATLWL